MSTQTSGNNKRIAKNTIVLYIRTIVVLLITLYTSRLVLNTLGVEDYGIYNVVGGVVAMFSVVSGSISTSISRFITFELGRNDSGKLAVTFSSSLTLLIGFAVIILVLGETVGLWFVNTQMTIPDGRLEAANYIYQFSLMTFALSLICIPYNACIMAYERMTAFTYISIFETIIKLAICLSLYIIPFDKLIYYGLMLFITQIIIRIIYGVYCSRNFEECRSAKLIYNKSMLKQLGGFAGWTSVMHSTFIFNTQGINILMNMFFGVAVNAARGIAGSVENAIMMFVNNFLTAVYPQITKLYADGKLSEMYKLICRSSKFAYFLLLIFALPIYLETETVLRLWIGQVPEHTVAFFRLSILVSALRSIGNTGNCGCQASGKVKVFSITMSVFTITIFPLTYCAYKMGMDVEVAYLIYIFAESLLILIRLKLLKKLIGFPPVLYIKTVLLPVLTVTLSSIIIPVLFFESISSSITRFFVVGAVCLLSVSLSILYLGCQSGERQTIINAIKHRIPLLNH